MSPVFYTTEGIPELLRMAQKIVPMTQSVEAMRAVMIEGHGLLQVMNQLTVLSVLASISLAIGYRRLEF